MEKQRNPVSWVRGKCIGKGSFGTVNLAFNKQNGAVFAVKSVNQNACGLLQAGALENEIQILRSLRSPYVVGFLGDDVSYESSTPYRNLHMEYLPGGTVAELATRGGADVDEKIVRSYAWCVVSALRYVHAQGIVHCDVKGKNILVGSATGSAKLADFGSAVELSSVKGGGAPVTPRGSPLWMAPEVVRGEYQGPESDVWSLGCTIIEMLTGKPAWKDNGIGTLSRIGFSDKRPGLPNQISESGRDFVEKCLRRDRSQRWSCDQLMQHPFISSASPDTIAESSPRCVLDWFSSEFNEQEEEYDDVLAMGSCSSSNKASVEDRMGKLVIKSGPNWESEGWMVVRSCAAETEKATVTSLAAAHSDSVRINAGIVGRAEWEFPYYCCCGSDLLCGHANGPTFGLFGCSGARNLGCSDSGGRRGSQKVDIAVERRGDLVRLCYGFSKLLLFVLQFLTVFRYYYSSFATYIICSLLALPFISKIAPELKN